MHPQALAYVATVAGRHGPFSRILDLGGRDVNGSPRLLFPAADYVTVDLVGGPGVDVVGDAGEYLGVYRFDLVLCLETLEHTPIASDIVANAWRNLRPGGRLIVTCATDPRPPHSGHDGGSLRPGEWYANIAAEELKGWLAPWDEVDIELHPDRGDLYACAVKPRRAVRAVRP